MTSIIKKVLSSRLNLKIASTVMLSIVLVEIIILVPSLFTEKHHKEMMAESHASILISTLESSLQYENKVSDPEIYSRLLGHHELVKGYAVCNMTDCPIKFGETVNTSNIKLKSPAPSISKDHTRLETTKQIMSGNDPYWLVLRTDISSFKEELLQHIINILGLIALICLFVTVTTTAGLYWIVLRPIQNLKGNIQNLLADPKNPLKYMQRIHSDDEIGDLTKTFNRLLFDINNYQEAVESAQKEVQKGLSASEARWKFALEGSGDGVWDWNPVSDDIYFSKQFLNALGYEEGEFITTMDKWTTEVLHPKDRPSCSATMLKHLKGDTDFFSMEHRVKHKDGRWVWTLSRGMVISRNELGLAARVVGTQTDITSHKDAEALIWRQANIDLLTGLPNRRLFQSELSKSIQRYKRKNIGPIVLMLLDLDNFKTINDTHGHQFGDSLLKEAAKRLNACVKGHGIAARLGGDEFTVVLEDAKGKDIIADIADNVLSELARPFVIGIETFHVSASIGITHYPEDAADIDTLIMNADQAMYASKENGRNRYNYFSQDMRTVAKNRMRSINELREAYKEEQFEVYYQPIIDFESGKIVKAEALLRWNHPTRGIVGADEVIPLSEETGLIVDIGNWVFQKGTKQLAEWQQKYEPNFQLSVNTSPIQYYHNDCIVNDWYAYMDTLGVDYTSLVVEITENLMLDLDGKVRAKLDAFRNGGVQLALDDFGTGYSSLAYLKNLKSNYLKIDRSFVSNIVGNDKNLALCLEIIKIAHIFDMQVIAEGIETQEQAWLLSDGGCDFAQGYFYSKPVSAEVFETYLIKQKGDDDHQESRPLLAANHL
ncbi:GGDEF domain-containing phosphodiesterase [Leucothrix arctica]|uniref:GGDEF domain-containing protein n=1 Tax=Leucothrix arctica TaxID=1481894 RepID=A0A317C9X3_9GAMM|nr:GGDEF domain-containing phosphodiesterase [Leucothrix arctica]PWQ95338.1 GGDEF domain-containing protein [Leucothrix arctica]